jgi:uncharacterized protein (DUF1684 family)
MTTYQVSYKKDLYAVIKKDTAFVKFYPVDPSYRVVATVEKLHGQQFFPMATSDGRAHQAIRYAELKFNLHDKDYILYAYQLSFLLSSTGHKNNFFVPFTDSSSGIGSYGGGKYIDFVIGDISADKKLVIDFNKSYNPYCAFRSGYSCPIPPKENDLPVEIKAGELNFVKPRD